MAAVVKNQVPGEELEQTSGVRSMTPGPIRSPLSKGHIYAEHLGAGHQKSPNPAGGNVESSKGMKKKGY